MLTKVQAYSSWVDPQTLMLDVNGRAETDFIQIRNIDGLEPVKAAVGTSSFGSYPGSSYIGSSTGPRNIVLTLHPNPDWGTWSFESLRRLLYRYFMPESLTKLVFYGDDISPVEISGYVEDFAANPFSRDPEFIVSIICPDPYFTAVDPTVVNGIVNDPVTEIEYEGDVEVGVNIKVTKAAGSDPTWMLVGMSEVGDVQLASVMVTGGYLSTWNYMELNSVPGQKYVHSINLLYGIIANLLKNFSGVWPRLRPGTNEVSIATNGDGREDWTITYYARYGGL